MHLNRKTRSGVLTGLLAAALIAYPVSASVDGSDTAAKPAPDSSDPVADGLMRGYPLTSEHAVNLTNWLEFHYNRWAFRNMRSLFPTGPIAAPATALPLAKGKPLDVESLTFRDADGALRTVGD
jgi:hypothetical protein